MSNNPISPLVTIRCLTYNHEPYIRQCLEGFVMQQTNFNFEAVVHDDASTDGTAAIIAEFAEKYPDIIKPLYETENQYSKRDGSLRRIMNAHTHGKYVAMCEGDDYWTDPLKLQKQVDFLEANKNVALCFHNAIEHSTDNEFEDRLWITMNDRVYSSDEIYKTWTIPTASVLIKREVFSSSTYMSVVNNKHFLTGDTPLFLSAGEYGDLFCISNEPMSVYRRHSQGATVIRDGWLSKKAIKSTLQFRKTFKKLTKATCNYMEALVYSQFAVKNFHKKHYFSMCAYFFRAFVTDPKYTIFLIRSIISNKIQ